MDNYVIDLLSEKLENTKDFEIKENEILKGVEVYFKEKPDYETIKKLKNLGFRWNFKKLCWYIKKSLLENKDKVENKNILGVKVGDVFCSSWGYEQTNLSFYVVTKLKGSQFVYLKECYLDKSYEKYDGYNGMARDVAFDTKKVHIKDDTKEILKKVKGTKENPYIVIENYEIARKYYGEKLYESWYY